MKNSRLIFLLLIAGMLCVSTQALANVFASNVRVTQQGGTGPFDCRFTDGTGVSIRFVLSDHADSVVVVIKQGATVVRNLTAKSLLLGDNAINWDGKDNAGVYVTTGSYALSLTTYDKGYNTYTTLLADISAAGLSQRGATTINNPALKSFGSVLYVDNGGFQSVTGPARLAADLEAWGDAKGVAKMSYTGATLGSNDAKWGVQSDEDGYVYVLQRNTLPKGIYRFHADSMKVVMVDSGYGAYYPFGVAVRKDAVGKTFAVVTDNNSATATLSGDSRVLTYHVNNDAPYFGTKDTLLKGNGTIMYWDVIFGRDSALYATFMYPGDLIHSGVAKFDLRGKTPPLTISDTVWTARLDTGRASTLSMFWGSATDGSKENAKTASGMVGQGVWAFTGLNTRPTRTSVYAGTASSSTRTDVSVDAVGNVVYVENSNETLSLISPPTGPNSYTTNASMQLYVIPSIPISAAIIDANKDFKPDSLGKTETVIGVVNNYNFQGSASLQYCIQEDSAGIMVFKSGAGGPVLPIGYRVAVTGVIAQYRGTTEITPAAFTDIQILDSNNVLTPVTLTIPQFYANAESYESRLIKINGIGKMPTTVAWPAAGTDANSFMMWDGWDSVLVRLDKDTPIPGSVEPVYPVNLQGVVTQYTSLATVYNDGYQLSPSLMSDFTANVQVPPSPHFALATPAKGSTVKLDSAAQAVVFSWKKALDLNTADKLTYQWAPVGWTAVATTNSGADTFLVRTGVQLRTLMVGKDTVTLKWTVKVKDPTNPLVSNTDTASVILVKGTIKEPLFTATPSPLNFGTVIGGSTKKDSVTVKNTGTDSLFVTAVASSNTQFTVTPTTARLDTSASQKFYITFAPISGTLQSTSIVFTTNTSKAKDTVKASGSLVSGVTIAEARKDVNADLIPDHSITKDTLVVYGVITSINFQPAATSYFMQDSTGGINIFSYTPNPTALLIGDSMFAIGQVAQYHGLTEFTPLAMDAAHLGLLKHNAKVPAAKHLTLHQFVMGAESYEGQLVEVDTLYKATGTWPASGANASVYVTNKSKADTTQMFLDMDTNIDGTPEPAYPINVVAIVSQYSSATTVYNNGYELMPRDTSDIKPITVVAVNQMIADIPTVYELQNNYPNPFNPSTTLRYGLPSNSKVTLKIYNILGQVVVDLVNEEQAAGWHTAIWNASVSSGMYFYRIEATSTSNPDNRFVDVKKMMLLK